MGFDCPVVDSDCYEYRNVRENEPHTQAFGKGVGERRGTFRSTAITLDKFERIMYNITRKIKQSADRAPSRGRALYFYA